MDSAPDSGGYYHTHNAVVLSQKSVPRRAAVSLLAHPFLILMYATFAIRGGGQDHLFHFFFFARSIDLVLFEYRWLPQ